MKLSVFAELDSIDSTFGHYPETKAMFEPEMPLSEKEKREFIKKYLPRFTNAYFNAMRALANNQHGLDDLRQDAFLFAWSTLSKFDKKPYINSIGEYEDGKEGKKPLDFFVIAYFNKMLAYHRLNTKKQKNKKAEYKNKKEKVSIPWVYKQFEHAPREVKNAILLYLSGSDLLADGEPTEAIKSVLLTIEFLESIPPYRRGDDIKEVLYRAKISLINMGKILRNK